jgi:hypothetical protein
MSRELPVHPSDEERIAADMARELEAMTTTTTIQPSDGFADRVMQAIAREPLPQPVRAFGLALTGGHLRAAASALGDAWRTISSRPAPVVIRAQALALVLVVLVASLAVAGGATVGAFGLLGTANPPPGPSGTPPSLPSATPSPSPSPAPDDTPSASPEESPTAEPSDTPEASKTPDSHETNGPTARPRTATPTATETDDHGDGSGSGSSGEDHTPSPTATGDHSGGD